MLTCPINNKIKCYVTTNICFTYSFTNKGIARVFPFQLSFTHVSNLSFNPEMQRMWDMFHRHSAYRHNLHTESWHFSLYSSLYRPQSEGDNAFGSVCPSVNALMRMRSIGFYCFIYMVFWSLIMTLAKATWSMNISKSVPDP